MFFIQKTIRFECKRRESVSAFLSAFDHIIHRLRNALVFNAQQISCRFCFGLTLKALVSSAEAKGIFFGTSSFREKVRKRTLHTNTYRVIHINIRCNAIHAFVVRMVCLLSDAFAILYIYNSYDYF